MKPLPNRHAAEYKSRVARGHWFDKTDPKISIAGNKPSQTALKRSKVEMHLGVEDTDCNPYTLPANVKVFSPQPTDMIPIGDWIGQHTTASGTGSH